MYKSQQVSRLNRVVRKGNERAVDKAQIRSDVRVLGHIVKRIRAGKVLVDIEQLRLAGLVIVYPVVKQRAVRDRMKDAEIAFFTVKRRQYALDIRQRQGVKVFRRVGQRGREPRGDDLNGRVNHAVILIFAVGYGIVPVAVGALDREQEVRAVVIHRRREADGDLRTDGEIDVDLLCPRQEGVAHILLCDVLQQIFRREGHIAAHGMIHTRKRRGKLHGFPHEDPFSRIHIVPADLEDIVGRNGF